MARISPKSHFKKAQPFGKDAPQRSRATKPMTSTPTKTLQLPSRFTFNKNGIYDFDEPLGWFDWSISNERVLIDFTECKSANYQTLSLLVLYVWHLKTSKCTVSFEFGTGDGASQMWSRMGAKGWFHVLHEPGANFKSYSFKPLFALRAQADFGNVLARAEEYTKGFDVEYEKNS